jgi:hypothetical protein
VKIHLPVVGPDLPVHPTKRHPRTGEPLQAVGFTRRGRVMWPVLGASPDDGGAGDAGGGSSGGTGDAGGEGDPPEGLGDAGKKALDAMKVERNAARQELKSVKDELAKLAPLQKLAEALGAKPGEDGPADVDALTARLARHEEDLTAERLARFRAEVAAEKKLTPAQAKRLVGTTREELATDADDLLKDFQPASGENGNGRRNGPRPDPSQGNRGDKPLSGREAALAEAEKRFGKKSTAT